MKKKALAGQAKPIVFTRADPAALAKFDPSTKRCAMNCGPHIDDPRSWQERQLLCDECYPVEPSRPARTSKTPCGQAMMAAQHEGKSTMSYSFNIKAATKGDAKAAVLAKVDEIVAQQPVHARDRAAVLANAGTTIDLLADDDNKDIAVTCNGYVSWASGTVDDAAFNSVSISCSAGHSNRE